MVGCTRGERELTGEAEILHIVQLTWQGNPWKGNPGGGGEFRFAFLESAQYRKHGTFFPAFFSSSKVMETSFLFLRCGRKRMNRIYLLSIPHPSRA